jgi:hypothetical protein
MKRHDLYFFTAKDANNALVFIGDKVTCQVVLSDDKVVFFTRKALDLFEQVTILQHINTYRPVFNREVQ